jgi:hypothetical protein
MRNGKGSRRGILLLLHSWAITPVWCLNVTKRLRLAIMNMGGRAPHEMHAPAYPPFGRAVPTYVKIQRAFWKGDVAGDLDGKLFRRAI